MPIICILLRATPSQFIEQYRTVIDLAKRKSIKMGVNIGTIQTNCRKPALNEPDADSRASADHGIEQLMIRYQQADPVATAALVNLVSPQLYRFFASRTNRAGAEEMLQDAWRRIHRSRHSYRPGEPMLPCFMQSPGVCGRRVVVRGSASHLLKQEWMCCMRLPHKQMMRAIVRHLKNLWESCRRASEKS